MTTRKTSARAAVPTVAAVEPTARPAITAEAVAYATLLAVAAVLRLVHLSWMPLDGNEAGLALPAWQAAHAVSGAAIVGSPLLFHLERLALWLLGGDEAVARLVPALAGVALVGAAARLRPWVGRPAALATAALLAVSPLWTFLGRQVSVSTVAALAVVVGLGALAGRSRRDGELAAGALAVAIAAGGLAYSALLAALLAALMTGGRRGPGAEVAARLWPDGPARRRAGLVFLLTLVLCATGLLTRPDGLAALVQLPGTWLQLLASTSGSLVGGYLLPLWSYAPVILLFGLAGLAILLRERALFGVFLGLWAVVALAFGWIAASPVVVPDLLLPLTLAAGVALGRLAERVAAEWSWSEDGVMVGLVLIVLGYGLLHALAYANAASLDEGMGAWRRAMGAMAMAVLLVGVFALLWSPRLALRVAGLSALVALAALAWSNGSYLNYRPAAVLREPMRPRYVTPDAGRLARTLAEASWAATRDPQTLAALVDPALGPLVAWELRERRNLRWALPQALESEGAVIVPAQDPEALSLALGPTPLRGQRYAVTGTWDPVFADSQTFVRWLLQRRPAPGTAMPGENPQFEQVDLYVRAGAATEAGGE